MCNSNSIASYNRKRQRPEKFKKLEETIFSAFYWVVFQKRRAGHVGKRALEYQAAPVQPSGRGTGTSAVWDTSTHVEWTTHSVFLNEMWHFIHCGLCSPLLSGSASSWLILLIFQTTADHETLIGDVSVCVRLDLFDLRVLRPKSSVGS